jgi:hypothetical protein
LECGGKQSATPLLGRASRCASVLSVLAAPLACKNSPTISFAQKTRRVSYCEPTSIKVNKEKSPQKKIRNFFQALLREIIGKSRKNHPKNPSKTRRKVPGFDAKLQSASVPDFQWLP